MSKNDSDQITQQQKQLIDALQNSTDEQVASLLLELKENGDTFYVESLLSMLTGQRSEMLKANILDYIANIKVQRAVPVISDFLENNFPALDITPIVTASWQSRLDFSEHLSPFLKILVEGQYKTAFEAFTVIENSIDGLTAESISTIMSIVKKGIVKADRDKQLLLLEMASILDKAKRATM